MHNTIGFFRTHNKSFVFIATVSLDRLFWSAILLFMISMPSSMYVNHTFTFVFSHKSMDRSVDDYEVDCIERFPTDLVSISIEF